MTKERDRGEWIPWYTDDSPGWLELSLAARGAAEGIARKMGRHRSVLHLGSRGLRGLAVLLRCRWEELEPALAELLAPGPNGEAPRLIVDESQSILIDPGHESRQRKTSTERVREFRGRRRNDVKRDETHETFPSRARSEEKRSEEILTPPAPSVQSPPAGGDTPAVVAGEAKKSGPRRKPRTSCPSSEASEAEVTAWAGTWTLPASDPRFAHFLDYHRKHGNIFADWRAAWGTWLRMESRFATKGRVDTRQPLLDRASADWLKAGGGDL